MKSISKNLETRKFAYKYKSKSMIRNFYKNNFDIFKGKTIIGVGDLAEKELILENFQIDEYKKNN